MNIPWFDDVLQEQEIRLKERRILLEWQAEYIVEKYLIWPAKFWLSVIGAELPTGPTLATQGVAA